jgi:uncharacterized membrane protein YdjX (TVP38/TMEM64 family)
MSEVERQGLRWRRLVVLAALTVALLVAGKSSGASAYFATERLRGVTHAAGAWGPLVFVLAFCVGELVHVPGVVFVAASVLAYGRAGGGALAFAGALIAVSVSFAIVRGIGGSPLAAIRSPLARRVLSRLDERPVRTILVLRLLLWMAPQLNYALALSNVRFRSYFLGTALGLVAPITGLVLLSDRVLR